MKKTNECCDKNKIVSEFYDQIFGYIIKRINNREKAQDITQEVMGRFIEAYNKNTPVKNIKAWLFQVTRNIIIDKYRKMDNLEFDNDKTDDISSEEEFKFEAEDYIIPMIKLLPKEYGLPLLMSDIEKRKQSEIAEKLNISLSATKMRCQRARKMLYNLFLECCNIEYTENGEFAYCTIKDSCKTLSSIEKEFNKKTK
ncbi:MAG: sigma-70 family RNA polymerase sigma factor [Marinifilaceae bacterium]|jgi:RNA polymerase sigma-70 factor (ECF subfamily)|nr:sigma-70 family RNA polymerase sigma factor [Marinifilaceae bacterium]